MPSDLATCPLAPLGLVSEEPPLLPVVVGYDAGNRPAWRLLRSLRLSVIASVLCEAISLSWRGESPLQGIASQKALAMTVEQSSLLSSTDFAAAVLQRLYNASESSEEVAPSH